MSVHYYNFNIGDYRRDTSHLSLLEHGVYRQLLDSYYLDEKPIETKSVIRRLSIISEDEKLALKNVLSDFFEVSECGNFYIHNRANEDIKRYRAKVKVAKANGSKGGRPPKPKITKVVNSGLAKKTKPKANQEPITNNQEPIYKEPTGAKIKEKLGAGLSMDLPDFISQAQWNEALKFKMAATKTLKKDLTDRVKSMLAKNMSEIHSAGFTIEESLNLWAENPHWKTMKLEYIENKLGSRGVSRPVSTKEHALKTTTEEQLKDTSWVNKKNLK